MTDKTKNEKKIRKVAKAIMAPMRHLVDDPSFDNMINVIEIRLIKEFGKDVGIGSPNEFRRPMERNVRDYIKDLATFEDVLGEAVCGLMYCKNGYMFGDQLECDTVSDMKYIVETAISEHICRGCNHEHCVCDED